MYKSLILPILASFCLNTTPSFAQETDSCSEFEEYVQEDKTSPLEKILEIPMIGEGELKFQFTYEHPEFNSTYIETLIRKKKGELIPLLKENGQVYFISNNHVFGESPYDQKAFPLRYKFINKNNQEVNLDLGNDFDKIIQRAQGNYLYLSPNRKNIEVSKTKLNRPFKEEYKILTQTDKRLISQNFFVNVQIPIMEYGTDKPTGETETKKVILKKVIGDPDADFCILSSDQPDIFTVFPYNIDFDTNIKPGDDLVIVSWNSKKYIQQITKGTVSALEFSGDFESFFLFQGDISHGNSGGMILKEDSRVDLETGKINYNYTLIGIVEAMCNFERTDKFGTTWRYNQGINQGVRMEKIGFALDMILFLDSIDYKDAYELIE